MNTMSVYRLFWRYLLPCAALMLGAMELYAVSMWLMAQPSDFAIAGGVLVSLGASAIVIGVVGYLFRGV